MSGLGGIGNNKVSGKESPPPPPPSPTKTVRFTEDLFRDSPVPLLGNVSLSAEDLTGRVTPKGRGATPDDLKGGSPAGIPQFFHRESPLLVEVLDISALTIESTKLPTLLVLAALDLEGSHAPQIEAAIEFIQSEKGNWIEQGVEHTIALDGIEIHYGPEFESAIFKVEGCFIDFDSLFFTKPEGTKLSDEDFYKELLFIVANYVDCFSQVFDSGDSMYLDTRMDLGSVGFYLPRLLGDSYHLSRSLFFSLSRKLFMNFNKKAKCLNLHRILVQGPGDLLLGTGGFKIVTTAVCLNTNKQFASAGIKLGGGFRAAYNNEIYRLNHFKGNSDYVQIEDHVIYSSRKERLVGGHSRMTVVDKGRIFLERLEGADLFEAVLQNKLSPIDKLSLIRDLIRIISSLHDEEIAHADIKLENFFVVKDSEGRFKLKAIDLGSFTDLTKKVSETKGTLNFFSPEYASVYDRYNKGILVARQELNSLDLKKVDVFALGCMIGLLFMDSLHPVLPEGVVDVSRFNLGSRILLRDPTPAPQPGGLDYLVWSMTRANPDERITMEQASLMFSEMFKPEDSSRDSF
jgi:hypothetical protein